MRHCEILLPFGLPPPELAADLLRSLQAPALAALLGKAAAPAVESFDPFARSLPHENWLAERMGLPSAAMSSPPMAAPHMLELGQTADEGHWFLLHPVHIHIARDHLVLTDRRRLPLAEVESRALFDMAKPAFEAAGKPLLYGNAGTWLVRADDWRGLQTASPDAACGHNVDIWMPKGPGEREWRKLQNEVQMEWHDNRINQEREARREQPVNSLWIWGGAAFPIDAKPPALHEGGFDTTKEEAFALLDDLSEPALAEDWGLWLERVQALEAAWFTPLLAALKGGKLERATLYLTHAGELRTFIITKSSLLKFWARPNLARLTS
ncbi:MAG TPA: hypothetical protein VF472_12730 [Burkholderiaceae bacterium]